VSAGGWIKSNVRHHSREDRLLMRKMSAVVRTVQHWSRLAKRDSEVSITAAFKKRIGQASKDWASICRESHVFN